MVGPGKGVSRSGHDLEGFAGQLDRVTMATSSTGGTWWMPCRGGAVAARRSMVSFGVMSYATNGWEGRPKGNNR